jgi:hypothetical protein
MDMGWIMRFASPTHPTAQLTVMRHDASSQIVPQVTVEVADVDAIHGQAVRRGVPVVYPLTDEPLGGAPLFRPRPERRRPQHHVPPSTEQEAQRAMTLQAKDSSVFAKVRWCLDRPLSPNDPLQRNRGDPLGVSRMNCRSLESRWMCMQPWRKHTVL